MASTNTQTIQGVWTALATPFQSDQQVDWAAFEKLLDLQKSGQVSGVVLAGTTGESPTLSLQEKLTMIRKARAILPSQIRVMAGTGDSSTAHSIELSIQAQDAGADSLLVVTPPYNKPSTAGLIQHYQSIVKSVKIPVCLYHVPGRTSQFLTVDQISTVCDSSKVQAVKEASGDIAYFSRSNSRLKIPFLSGDDPTFFASLAVGGAGVISVVSNIFPGEVVRLYNAFRAGRMDECLKIHNRLMPAIDTLLCEVNPSPLKAALQVLGLAQNVVRPPLATVTDANFQKISETIQATARALKNPL